MRSINIAVTSASFGGNKSTAAMLQSCIKQLKERCGECLNITLLSAFPDEDKRELAESPERYDFAEIVGAKPLRLLLTLPLAGLYGFFRHIPLIRGLFRKNRIIGALAKSDLVVDISGTSFSDDESLSANLHAFVCAAIPTLCGIPVCKYSQTMGAFKYPRSRLPAKWILPKLKLICAHGEATRSALESIGISKNVRVCADGAFSMPDSGYYSEKTDGLFENDGFFTRRVIGISVSGEAQKRCAKLKTDYKGIMTQFINWLNGKDYSALIISDAADGQRNKPRGGDLSVCEAVYEAVRDKSKTRLLRGEMPPEELRELIARCEAVVACLPRFLTAALGRCVPALYIGSDEGAAETLEMFELREYALSCSSLDQDSLKTAFMGLLHDSEKIRGQISGALPGVLESSRENAELIGEQIDRYTLRPKRVKQLNINDPEKYIGAHLCCRAGCAADNSIRKNAGAGGMATALLCHLLESGQIDGAWITRAEIKGGKVGFKTLIAKSPEQIRECASPVYLSMPLMRHIERAEKFNGRLAVVLLPCHMRAFSRIIEKNPKLKEKIVLKISLFCGGTYSENVAEVPLKKAGITLSDASRLYFRRGESGQTSVAYRDGSEKSVSYEKNIGAYKDAFYFLHRSCGLCQDHFGYSADISFGEIAFKDGPRSACVIRTEKALALYRSAVEAGAVACDKKITDEQLLESQKRGLAFKWNCAKAKRAFFKQNSASAVYIDCSDKCGQNHKLAFKLISRNMKFSEENPEKAEKRPVWLVRLQRRLIRFLLSF